MVTQMYCTYVYDRIGGTYEMSHLLYLLKTFISLSNIHCCVCLVVFSSLLVFLNNFF